MASSQTAFHHLLSLHALIRDSIVHVCPPHSLHWWPASRPPDYHCCLQQGTNCQQQPHCHPRTRTRGRPCIWAGPLLEEVLLGGSGSKGDLLRGAASMHVNAGDATPH